VAVARATGDVDAPAGDHRVGQAAPRQLGLPAQALGVGPLLRQAGLFGDARAAGATELGPVARRRPPGDGGEERDQNEKNPMTIRYAVHVAPRFDRTALAPGLPEVPWDTPRDGERPTRTDFVQDTNISCSP